jgi:hypothetical protein
MSAECDTHGTDLLWDNDGDGPTYCPSCHLDTLTAQRERLLTQLEKAADDLAGIVSSDYTGMGGRLLGPGEEMMATVREARAIIEEIRKEDAQ